MASPQIPSVLLIPLEKTASAYMINRRPHSSVVEAVTCLINVEMANPQIPSVLLRLPEFPLVK